MADCVQNCVVHFYGSTRINVSNVTEMKSIHLSHSMYYIQSLIDRLDSVPLHRFLSGHVYRARSLSIACSMLPMVVVRKILVYINLLWSNIVLPVFSIRGK